MQRRIARVIASIGLAVLTANCSGDGLFGRSGSSPSLGDRFSNLFGSSRPAQPQLPGTAPTVPATLPEDFDCPGVTVRDGASTFAVSAQSPEPSVMNLRYQASIGQTARECRLVGTDLGMKVGMEGRIILGPAGGPGPVQVPVRFAVVREGPEPKTIFTKLYWADVTVPPGETNVPFTLIQDDVIFPMPRQGELDAYVVYVGFDQSAVKEPVKKKPARKPAPPRRAN